MTPTGEGEERAKLLHRCVKGFTDSILDLLVDPHPKPPQPELLYLGPDENITPFDIDWVISRAGERGYSMAPAFMSSKPREGINHKVYGVTSEGVAVFLEQARHLPTSPRISSHLPISPHISPYLPISSHAHAHPPMLPHFECRPSAPSALHRTSSHGRSS